MDTRSEWTTRTVNSIRSLRLTGRGRGFVIAVPVGLVAARILDVAALTYVACLLLGMPLFGAMFVLFGQSKLSIARTFSPHLVRPGAAATATVTCTNLSALPSLAATWQDSLATGVSGAAGGSLAALGGAQTALARTQFSYSLWSERRGQYDIGPLIVHAPDPFGLVFRRCAFGQTQRLTVLPRQVDLAEISFGTANSSGASRPASRNVGIGDDDVIARSYLAGDSLRRIHWKATAHRGMLMVRQEEQYDKPEAAVVLDLDADAHGVICDHRGVWSFSPAFEWSIMAAASVTAHLVKRGYVVNVIAPGGSIERSVADGLDTIEDVLTDLAIVRPRRVSAGDIARIGSSERPIVAILGRVDDDKAVDWSRLNASTGLALVAAGSSRTALATLSAAGWKCRSYRPRDDVAQVWLDLDAKDFHAAP